MQNLTKFVLALALAICLNATAASGQGTETIKISIADGKIHGKVFAELQDQEAPVAGKVTLTDIDGNTVTTLRTDEDGNFYIADIKPGKYRAIGVAGDYVGDAEIEVTFESADEEDGVYAAIPLAVAPSTGTAIFNMYSNLSASAFSQCSGGCAPAATRGCGSCGGSFGGRSFGGFGNGSFGGYGGQFAGGGLRGFGSQFGLARLGLIGTAIAIPVALSASPDE